MEAERSFSRSRSVLPARVPSRAVSETRMGIAGRHTRAGTSPPRRPFQTQPPTTNHPPASPPQSRGSIPNGLLQFTLPGDQASTPRPKDLLKQATWAVKSRTGSVLSRGFILKADFVPSASSLSGNYAFENEDGSVDGLHLRGAPNFRAAELDVYGVAQPTETGVRTILSVLRSQPVRFANGSKGDGRQIAWFCTREEPVLYIGGQPFVLRDAQRPTKINKLSDRAETLEEIETRLKNDIIKEAARYGGLILVHEESRETAGTLVNTWIAADSVHTIREVFEEVRSWGYNVLYYRVPVARDQRPDERYFDAYTEILRNIPIHTSLVFNCGVGVVRTTISMCAALIIRRKQLIMQGEEDPFPSSPVFNSPRPSVAELDARRSSHPHAVTILRAQNQQTARDQSLLQLTALLQKCLHAGDSSLSLLAARPKLLESLRLALMGNYEHVMSLVSTLDDGIEQKAIVDGIVDECSVVVNLRQIILEHRLQYAASASNEATSRGHRSRAIFSLERYFGLITFASYINDNNSLTTSMSFSDFLESRPEITNMMSSLRKSQAWGIFAPVGDLSDIVKGLDGYRGIQKHIKRRGEELEGEGEFIGEEWASQIVMSRGGVILRSGMILKRDQWETESENVEENIRGTTNFRKVPGSSLYGLAQPTQEATKAVLDRVTNDKQEYIGEKGRVIVWINLREEPFLFINGVPYVLRQEATSLRNVKSYAGISSSRLELLETRLKNDVIAEISNFDNRLLIHSEGMDGIVNPYWETIEDFSGIQTPREFMDSLQLDGIQFTYLRIPITAERAPDFDDVQQIVQTVTQLDINCSSIIVNCQLGRGRSTRVQILITLLQKWMKSGAHSLYDSTLPHSTRASYTVINNLLRTIKSGLEVKDAVDEAVELCSETFDLVGAIEDSRVKAKEAKADGDVLAEKQNTERGILNLRTYFFLILFSSFLNESRVETSSDVSERASYESYVKSRPEFKTIERELNTPTLEMLAPLENAIQVGAAFSDEVKSFVARRSGRILSAYTLLKSDFFSGLQKMSLPERVEGAPNFRRVPLLLTEGIATPVSAIDANDESPLVYGSGMPSIEGLRRALDKMDGKNKQIIWTSMREEPVIFVSGGRPHVLRLHDNPLENVITTGVTAQTVEQMERSLQTDILNELANNDGKILLHDEIQEPNGTFTVTATWENLEAYDVRTPIEVFAMMRDEGYLVDYERIPVTDEQAPLPGVLNRLYHRVSGAIETATELNGIAFVFNCQMGRGRTTTGMVTTALIANILLNRASIFNLNTALAMAPHTDPRQPWETRDLAPYLDGEYKVILQLVGVLRHGKMAKKLADRCIDSMESVQNLRKAIYDFKLRTEAAEAGTPKAIKSHEIAINYLFRYASLIVFANFMLEVLNEEESEEKPKVVDFPKWLEERREIRLVLSRKSLD